MTLYIPHSIFHLARLLYVRPEAFGPYYVQAQIIARRTKYIITIDTKYVIIFWHCIASNTCEILILLHYIASYRHKMC